MFIKNTFGKYTIDERSFNVEPRTVYFTNLGIEWDKITDTCLITFNESYLKEYVHADIYDNFSFLLTETVDPRKLSETQFETIEKLYHFIHEQHLTDSPYKNQIIGQFDGNLTFKNKGIFFSGL